MPKTIRYVRYGQWAAHAKQVAKMVAKGRGVSEAVRRVVDSQNYPDKDKAFNGIRAAYYERKKREEFQI